jgi:hypothetical protein
MTLTRVGALIPWCLMELAQEAWADAAPSRLTEVDERLLVAAGVTEAESVTRLEIRAPGPEPASCDDDRRSRPAARRAERVRIEQPQPGRVALRLAIARKPVTMVYQDASSDVDLVRCPALVKAR